MFAGPATQLRQFDDNLATKDDSAFEAQSLFALLECGETVDGIRRLIEVPPDVEATLRAFIRANPEEGFEIEQVLSFRQRVSEEFERLIFTSGVCWQERSGEKVILA